MSKVLASVGSKRSTLVFQLLEYKGTKTLDIRKHFLNTETHELVPTRKGISLAEKTFTIVQNVLDEYGGEIGAWLDGKPNTVREISSDQRVQSRRLEELRYLPRERSHHTEGWKSPEFYRVEAEGGCDKLIMNESHSCQNRITELLDRIIDSESQEVRQDAADDIKNLIAMMLISFERARRLFSGAADMPPEMLFDTLLFNWGAILETQIRNGGTTTE